MGKINGKIFFSACCSYQQRSILGSGAHPPYPRFNVDGDVGEINWVGETGQINGKGFYPERPNFETGGVGEA